MEPVNVNDTKANYVSCLVTLFLYVTFNHYTCNTHSFRNYIGDKNDLENKKSEMIDERN